MLARALPTLALLALLSPSAAALPAGGCAEASGAYACLVQVDGGAFRAIGADAGLAGGPSVGAQHAEGWGFYGPFRILLVEARDVAGRDAYATLGSSDYDADQVPDDVCACGGVWDDHFGYLASVGLAWHEPADEAVPDPAGTTAWVGVRLLTPGMSGVIVEFADGDGDGRRDVSEPTYGAYVFLP